MNKKDRQILFDKYNGRCAYCGCELNKYWQVDHVEPVNRIQKRVPGYYRNKETGEKVEKMPEFKWYMTHERVNDKYVFDKFLNPENDTVENSLPACRSCNITKSNFNLEEFRQWIQGTCKQLDKNNNASYKFGKRFGLIQETPKEIIFYFETLTIPTNSII